MTLSLKMRPIWVCMKLCGGDVISASLLAEIFFRANITIYKAGDNPLLAFSLEEWGKITGFSIGQVRKALAVLEATGLVAVYNKKHPFKGVLRALHVEVPIQIHDLYDALVSGMYHFEGDVLHVLEDPLCAMAFCIQDFLTDDEQPGICPPEGHIDMPSMEGAITMSTGDIPLCASGTHLSIYKKESKNELVAANIAAMGEEGEKKEEEVKKVEEEIDKAEVPEVFKNVSTMIDLLIGLRAHYMEQLEKHVPVKKAEFNASDAGKLWDDSNKFYNADLYKELGPKEYKLLKMLLGFAGKELVIPAIKGVLANWEMFAKCVLAHHSALSYAPGKPDVGFFYKFFPHAVYLHVYKLQEYSDWFTKDK